MIKRLVIKLQINRTEGFIMPKYLYDACRKTLNKSIRIIEVWWADPYEADDMLLEFKLSNSFNTVMSASQQIMIDKDTMQISKSDVFTLKNEFVKTDKLLEKIEKERISPSNNDGKRNNALDYNIICFICNTLFQIGTCYYNSFKSEEEYNKKLEEAK